MLKIGLWRFGLPYAVGAAGINLAITDETDVVSVAIQWAMAGVLFGLATGALHWHNGTSALRARTPVEVG